MEKTLKLKYVAPEVVDFKWMESLGHCAPNGSGATGTCTVVGNGASAMCSAGSSAGTFCTVGSGS